MSGQSFRRTTMQVTLLVAIMTATSLLWAQSYTITRRTIDNGGGEQVGAQFSMHGTIGQPDASSVVASANYQLSGGFWPGSVNQDLPDGLFSDGFEN